MRRTATRFTIIVAFVVVLSGFLVLGFAAGVWRYGSVEGLERRIRTEIASRQSHPAYVPTPLASPASTEASALRMQQALAAAPPDTVTPAPPPPTVTPTFTIIPPSATSTAQPTDRPTATPRPTDEPSPTPTPTDTPTSVPSATPTETAIPTATATATPVHQPAENVVALTGFRHYWQTWNNCGPATLAMYLSYYGGTSSQADVAVTLRPDHDDKNVSPEEMASFARSQGLEALVRVNGDAELLRLLVSNGLPVLIETWHEAEPNNGMGHYRLLMGYDDNTQEWIAYDSYDRHGVDFSQPYAGIRFPYAEFDALWRVFNRVYLVIYPAEQATLVASIIGDDMDDGAMWARALGDSQAVAGAYPEDAYAWFNLGSNLVGLGQFEPAAAAYDQARQLGLPWRMLWYQFGPFHAYYEVERYDEVIALADATLKIARNIEELYYWKGLALQAKGDVAGARAAFQAALKFNPNYADAANALAGISG